MYEEDEQKRRIYNNRDLTKEGGKKKGMRLLDDREGMAHPRPRANGSFSLGCWAIRFSVLFIPKTSRRLIKAQLLDPLSTNSL